MRWNAPEPDELVLEHVNGALELRAKSDKPGFGVVVDLAAIRPEGWKRTPLSRSLGKCRTVIDATAGLCTDSFQMALAGCSVIAIERAPLLVELIKDGLRRAARDPRVDQGALERLSFIAGDAKCIMPTLPSVDAILLDPMFPPKRKSSALSKKSIRIVGSAASSVDCEGDGGAALLTIALSRATNRVLVKRADDSPPLAAPRMPDVTYRGSTSRVDGYLVGIPIR